MTLAVMFISLVFVLAESEVTAATSAGGDESAAVAVAVAVVAVVVAVVVGSFCYHSS